MVRYRIVMERDGDALLVHFPDFPEAHTFGSNELAAMFHASEALSTVIDGYIADRRPVPEPSEIAPDDYWVPLGQNHSPSQRASARPISLRTNSFAF